MKQRIKLLGIIALAAIIGFGAISCDTTTGPAKKPLTTPGNVRIDHRLNDVDYAAFTLKWDAVPGADEYKIDIDGTLYSVGSSKTEYELKELTENPRSSKIKVRAVAASGDTKRSDSKYSPEISCETADYVFTYGNGGAASSVQTARAAGAGAAGTITGLTPYGNRLEKIVIPEKIGSFSITAIGDNAFAGNTVIKEIFIADSITVIGDGAFSNCTMLIVVVFLSVEPPEMGDDVFKGSDSIENIYVPDGSDDKYKNKLPDEVIDKIIEGEPDPVLPGDGEKIDATLTITGLDDWNGMMAMVMLVGIDENDEGFGYGDVENDKITITAFYSNEPVEAGTDWREIPWKPTANKRYWLFLELGEEGGDNEDDDDEKSNLPPPKQLFAPPVKAVIRYAEGTVESNSAVYWYTNGQSLQQLGLTDGEKWGAYVEKNTPNFAFTSSAVTVDLSKFAEVPEEWLHEVYVGGSYSITITDLPSAWNGAFGEIEIQSKDDTDDWGEGDGIIAGGRVTVHEWFNTEEFWVDEKGGYWDWRESPWTPKAGQGYLITFNFESAEGAKDAVWGSYLYTNGKTLQQLGVTTNADGFVDWEDLMSKAPVFAFPSEFATEGVMIPFSQFLDISDIFGYDEGTSYDEIFLDKGTLDKVLGEIKKNPNFTIGSTTTTWGSVASLANYTYYEDLNKDIIDYYWQQYENDGYSVINVGLHATGSDGKLQVPDTNTPLTNADGKATIWVGIEYEDGGSGNNPIDLDKTPITITGINGLTGDKEEIFIITLQSEDKYCENGGSYTVSGSSVTADILFFDGTGSHRIKVWIAGSGSTTLDGTYIYTSTPASPAVSSEDDWGVSKDPTLYYNNFNANGTSIPWTNFVRIEN